MAEIVLTTQNARYWHSAFGLRYLLANLQELQSRATLLEFGIKDATNEVLEAILSEQPVIVGIGVYIWNIEQATKLVADLKQVAPEVIIVLGGPEVSYEWDDLPIVTQADYLITGEGDIAFRELCRDLLTGRKPLGKVIPAGIPPLAEVQLPYELYTTEDIEHRVLYVEASRGCPFTCEFCLSSLEIPVRQFELEQFLGQMQNLFDRGARQFKFVDRTFNLNMRFGQSILQFFLDRYEPGLFLHFEMIPDRLPESLREMIQQFPPGVLQFEIGVQTFNPEVGKLISRKQNVDKLEDNFRFLRQQTGVHIHADLIVGLPGETLESFGAGFDRLVGLNPQEIQVGILKRLRGTPITRHDAEWEMRYSPHPPYEILSNRLLDFVTMQRMRRFARYWDLIANSGNFTETCTAIWEQTESPFTEFLRLTDWLYQQIERTHAIPLPRLAELLFQFLTQVQQLDAQSIAERIWQDYTRGGREDRPQFLRNFDLPLPPQKKKKQSKIPARQARHVAVQE
ncbi:B12-binding domain-containing radical SAM protein [Rubinisphaera sp.]|uniref:B12-binding domain-containing radical SAM protein n=1 Tax=Rubinisphaera sp. TaxID=2024857 RepID=UPI000C10E1B5|nr:B12-binding domain-containing radical SAM protein [Rubinisphaera sp.]MBV08037.1 B12-binding domain-containing radical SAM protein [Rubinisphaera sp.]|tara:strand:- start:137 stop:1669 length:1533 start_codon:yes stop_codon:yes gene_type:complete